MFVSLGTNKGRYILEAGTAQVLSQCRKSGARDSKMVEVMELPETDARQRRGCSMPLLHPGRESNSENYITGKQ